MSEFHLSSRGFRGGPSSGELAAIGGNGGVQSCGGAVVLALQLLQPRLQLAVPADMCQCVSHRVDIWTFAEVRELGLWRSLLQLEN